MSFIQELKIGLARKFYAFKKAYPLKNAFYFSPQQKNELCEATYVLLSLSSIFFMLYMAEKLGLLVRSHHYVWATLLGLLNAILLGNAFRYGLMLGLDIKNKTHAAKNIKTLFPQTIIGLGLTLCTGILGFLLGLFVILVPFFLFEIGRGMCSIPTFIKNYLVQFPKKFTEKNQQFLLDNPEFAAIKDKEKLQESIPNTTTPHSNKRL